MKKYRFNKLVSVALVLVMALAVFATSCTPRTEPTSKVGVVVTILPQVEFVESVGGEKVDITVMVPPGANPHAYGPTPEQLTAVKQARIYAKVGSPVEFELTWMDKIRETNKNMLVVDCSQGVELIGKNPHIWLSPRNAKIMVKNICDGLTKIDPQNKAYYIENRDTYLEKLGELDKSIKSSLGGITNRSFMIFHPAWGYFARDYDLRQIPIEKEGKEATAAGVVRLIKQAKTNNIKVIFVSPQFDVKSAETIAEAIDGRVAFINPLAQDYVNNMHAVLGELVQGME